MVGWFLAGIAVEVANTFSRTWSVDRLFSAEGRAGFVWLLFALGFLVRLGTTAAVLALAFRGGALHGMAALAGYWLSRWAIVWWQHRAASTPA